MKTRTKLIISGAAVVALTAAGTGVAISSDDDDGTEVPITGIELEQASRAALEHTGGGTVVETEVGDEESYYEVEVKKLDGTLRRCSTRRTVQCGGCHQRRRQRGRRRLSGTLAALETRPPGGFRRLTAARNPR